MADMDKLKVLVKLWNILFPRLYGRDINSFKFTGSKVSLVGYKWFTGLQFHKHLRGVQLAKLLRFLFLLGSF